MLLEIIAYIVIGIYTAALALITAYCLMQFHLLFKFKKNKEAELPNAPVANELQDLPYVTIQLPVYNERYVVERLIDNIVKINYPADKLEIQVLDDSTDVTSTVCQKKIEEYAKKGVNIDYHRRHHREGFKAGALREGLAKAKGEFIAIFDADFMPEPDFLLKTIPYFKDPRIGVVQTRWEHINENYSLITRLQAFQLNVHFTIEQAGRQTGGYLLQFNGTAGVWRREAIVDAGGWQPDTLTEDLDLSYRAQLKGWRIKYLQSIVSPAELPSEMTGLKSQQFRWMKGGAENAKRFIPAILKSEMPFLKKLHAASHLLSSTIFLFVFLLAVMSVPAVFLMNTIHLNVHFYGLFMIGMLATGSVYFVANEATTWSNDPLYKRVIKFILRFPLFLCMSMGLSLHNSIAVIQGYLGKKSIFVRTPKFNIKGIQDKIRRELHEASHISGVTMMEGMLALYFLIAVIIGIDQGQTAFIIYHFMLMIGFGSIFIYSVKHVYQR